MKKLFFILSVLFLSFGSLSAEETAEATPSKHGVWIKLDGDVDPGMADFVKRAIHEASLKKPDYILFEINTFGGRLDAAYDIVDTIMGIKNIRTVSLVRQKAISAGALIALSSRELYMLPGTTIGDCAPIVQGSDGTPTIVGEKIQSPLRAKFRNLAQQNHYPELLSEAMVSPDLEVLELTRGDSILVIEGKHYAKFSEKEKAFWGSPKILVAAGELLTMTDKEAAQLHFSKGSVKSKEELEEKLQIIHQSSVEITWSEKLARFIGAISGILLIIGFGALYLEFKTPGFGIFGVIGIIAIAIVFLGQYSGSLHNYLPLILLIIGMILFVLEIFVLPGTFIFGVLGIGFMMAALAITFQDVALPGFLSNLTQGAAPWLRGLFYVMITATLALTLPLLATRYLLPRLPQKWSPILHADLEDSHSPTEAVTALRVGDSGIAKTMLRPVGHGEFNGELFDVNTRGGEIIEAGTPIRITAILEGRIWVAADKNG